MSDETDHSAAFARRFFEHVWNRRSEAIDEFAHPDAVSHRTDGTSLSGEQFREAIHRPFLAAFPDLHIAGEDVLARNEQAVVRWYATGTHLGEGFGIKPTGRQVAFRGMTWFVLREGKIVEGWDCRDSGGLFQSLTAGDDGKSSVTATIK